MEHAAIVAERGIRLIALVVGGFVVWKIIQAKKKRKGLKKATP